MIFLFFYKLDFNDINNLYVIIEDGGVCNMGNIMKWEIDIV